MKIKQKFFFILLSAVLLLAMSTTALAADQNVNVKYATKLSGDSYLVYATITPADGQNNLSYVKNPYLLVSVYGEPFDRIYFNSADLKKASAMATASINMDLPAMFTFTICAGNDKNEIGVVNVGGENKLHTYTLDLEGNDEPGIGSLNPFTDVRNNVWYTDYISQAYALGLMNGVTKTTFGPNQSMTVAQAVVLATRMNQLTTTGKIEDYSDYKGRWFEPYFNYAINKGFVDKSYMSIWNKNATRAQFADIFADCVPKDFLPELCDYPNGSIPDVKMSDKFGRDIYLLYQAGILQGSDSLHNFKPNTTIKRSEISAIVVRMMVEEERIGYVPGEDEYIDIE